MAQHETSDTAAGVPAYVGSIIVPLVFGALGLLGILTKDELPGWVSPVATLIVLGSALVLLWTVGSLAARAIRPRLRRRRANRENTTAIAAEMTRLADGISLSHTRCIYSLGNRLVSDKILPGETLLTLGTHLRALMSWLTTEQARLNRSAITPLEAFETSGTILASYVSVCNVIGGFLRGAVSNGQRLDTSIRGDWESISGYANGLVHTHDDIAGRVVETLRPGDRRPYIESVNSAIG